MMYVPSQDPRRVLSRAMRKCPDPEQACEPRKLWVLRHGAVQSGCCRWVSMVSGPWYWGVQRLGLRMAR